jgi:hypothetical protein
MGTKKIGGGFAMMKDEVNGRQKVKSNICQTQALYKKLDEKKMTKFISQLSALKSNRFSNYNSKVKMLFRFYYCSTLIF